jgi:nucleoside-diphosphate-sugar epimerase
LNRVLLTGASGFVGRSLCATLAQAGYEVRAAVRTSTVTVAGAAEHVCVEDISERTDWRRALTNVDCVIHSAARAHRLNDPRSNSGLYISTNTEGTACLARAASQAGVRRFVFLSSVKVNGEEVQDRAYSSSDEPRPQDAYGVSKWLAEKAVNDISIQTGMEFAIVRPPLVYGPGVRANFLRLLHWVDAQWPLPIGAVRNCRSLISIWNLCDLLVNLVKNPAAKQGTWMASDGHDLSSPELVRRIAEAMHRRVRLVSVPVPLLQMVGRLTGRAGEVRRMCGSLVVDVSLTREVLGWVPPLSVDEGLSRTVAWYLAGSR